MPDESPLLSLVGALAETAEAAERITQGVEAVGQAAKPFVQTANSVVETGEAIADELKPLENVHVEVTPIEVATPWNPSAAHYKEPKDT